MRIGFVLPPSIFLLDDRAFLYGGPLQIAALARRQGHEVEVFDATGHMRRCKKAGHLNADCNAEVLRHACQGAVELAGRVDLVGFYSLAAQHSTAIQMLAAVKAAYPDRVCAIGGPHTNTAPRKVIADGFDYAVVADQGGGGGEPGFLALVQRIVTEGGAPVARPRGLSVVAASGGGNGNGHGACHVAASDPRIVSVASREGGLRSTEYVNDIWPWPARDLVDVESYRYFVAGRRVLHTITQTGCPYACTFCSHWPGIDGGPGYTKLGLRSPEHVEAELRQLRAAYPWCGGLMLYDDEVQTRWDFEGPFLDVLARWHRRYDWVWRAFWKSGKKWCSDDRLFRLTAEAGFKQLCTGCESGAPTILKAIKKGASLEDNTHFVRFCIRHGIKPKVFMQVGLGGWLADGTPIWETPDTVEQTRRWLVAMAAEGLQDIDVAITTPYEGTPLRNAPQAKDPARPQKGENPLIFDVEEIDRVERQDTLGYKGRPGEIQSYVATPDMSRADLVAAREYLDMEFARASGQRLEEVTLVRAAGGEDVVRVMHDDG